MGLPSVSQWIQWICQKQKRKARWFCSVSLMSMQDLTPDKVCMNRHGFTFCFTVNPMNLPKMKEKSKVILQCIIDVHARLHTWQGLYEQTWVHLLLHSESNESVKNKREKQDDSTVYHWCPCKTSHLTRFVWTDQRIFLHRHGWHAHVLLSSIIQINCHPLQMCCCRMAVYKNYLSLGPKSDKSKSLFPRHQKEREGRKLHSTLLTLFYMWGWCHWCRHCQNLHRPGAGWAWMECCVQPAEFHPPSPPTPRCSCPPQQPCPETQQTGLNLFTANKFAPLMPFTSRNHLEKRLSWPKMLPFFFFFELCCRLKQLRSWNSNRKLSSILQADLLKTLCQWHHMISYGHKRVNGLAYLGK